MILWRPVGLAEAALVFESGMRRFPPRLPEQPIFYPVLVEQYADQIASTWNTKDAPFAGYVFQMEIPDDYAAQFPPQTVGASVHRELWVPADRLDEFNEQMTTPVVPRRAFFGESFRGHVPDKCLLRGADAFKQVAIMISAMDYSLMDFALEVSVNAATIFLNYPFWKAAGANRLGVDPIELERCLELVCHAWVRTPRPAPLIEDARFAA